MFEHYILTRFNYTLYSSNAYKVLNPDKWMEHRLKLFEKCRDSVLSQDVDFTWLIAMDSNTPLKYMDQIFIDTRMHPVFCLIGKVFEVAKPNTPWVITTRLDNDDFYNKGALREVQNVAGDYIFNGGEEGFVIDLEYHQRIGDDLYPSKRPRNNSPFLSLVERSDDPRTCYCRPHTDMIKEFKSTKIKKPLANMVLHDMNQMNRLLKNSKKIEQ